MAHILIINGPNLNLLGTREPGHYGTKNLPDIIADLENLASSLGHDISHIQSNSEAELIDQIHQARNDATQFIIINPAALTHTSVALRDAISGVAIPFIEVHLSNIHSRESFRQQSYFSDIAAGVISGLGAQGYELALRAADNQLTAK